jgi:hypothetical protein
MARVVVPPRPVAEASDSHKRVPSDLNSWEPPDDVARRSGNVGVVLVSRTGDPLIEPLRSRSAVRLLVHSSRGQYFLTGIRPWTPHFAPALHRQDGTAAHPYELVPIV